MHGRHPEVDLFLSKPAPWVNEIKKIRAIMLDCDLTEEWKWGKPCYSFQGGNIVIIAGFKNCCALLFCKGALIKDPHGILIKPGENTQAARQMRFTGVGEIAELEPILRSYLLEAVEVEKAGLEVDYKESKILKYPAELENELNGNSAFKKAFETLTPGRRRAYNMYFSAPKQSKTRVSRIHKFLRQILHGKGMNDR